MGGSYESIHNDTSEPVEVFWQLLGGWAPDGGWDKQILWPKLSTASHRLSLSLVHQVCVRYPIQGPDQKKVCKVHWSPGRADRTNTYEVTEIIGKNAIPSRKEKLWAKVSSLDPRAHFSNLGSWFRNKPTGVAFAQPTAYDFELYVLPGLVALTIIVVA